MMNVIRIQTAEPLIEVQINTDITGRHGPAAANIHPVVSEEFLIISIVIANFKQW